MPEPTRCRHRSPDEATRATGGQCPACLMELGLADGPAGRGDAAGTLSTSDRPTVLPATETIPRLAPGAILGERYRIESRLGAGAMGEVWRASDLRLRVEVALKALPASLVGDAKRREMLRGEVRSAHQVISPNVCRIHDLVLADGQELISMEYIDGVTLAEELRRAGPLDIRRASEIGMQLLAGLEAIHGAGFVHRDIKPENVMLTRAGRVVVMDFGIARELSGGEGGTVAGTPAYMAPEQRRGERPDPRWDLFAAGAVLAEMLVSHEESRDLLRGIREEPPRLPDSPWRPLVERAVARRQEDRPPSARSMGQALEEVTLRETVAKDRRPYPGLSSFGAEDAEFFFGREAEVEEVWKKLRQPHLLGVIGPSGAGKSSFLRAGLLPAMPADWRAVVCTPGTRPLVALAQALAPQLAGDAEAMAQMVQFGEPDVAVELVRRWKGKRAGALVIVDQFEELFTLCPPETQTAFAELLGRLVLDADVHVLLSMRDDFLIHCRSQLALAPLFSDLTVLLPPTGSALRRALVQPARKCGYRFEDEDLVDEMLAEVRQERGALPLLAFAVSRLWERRDRGLLTRQAYEEIGGVAGALAQHAERTLERIGSERKALVREMFQNLVTSHGTRAVRGWDELLEVFEERDSAEAVLRGLVDAHLLTTYVETGEEEEPLRRVEIIHESLLTAWPRLVRWRTQDEDSAQLRDQLRMAAQMWEERGRPSDLLWSGTAYREYELWRERFPGGLTAREEAFTDAMVRRAERQRRRRRIAIGTVIASLVVVAAVVSALWLRSVRAEREAQDAEQVARAQQLFALGQLRIEDDPTAALAYATASLERADDPRVRLLAMRALSMGPVAISASAARYSTHVSGMAFSPDGRLLATGHWVRDEGHSGLRIWSREGGPSWNWDEFEQWPWLLHFSDDSEHLIAGHPKSTTKIWSVRDGELLREIPSPHGNLYPPAVIGERILTIAADEPDGEQEKRRLQSWPLQGGAPTDLGRFPSASAFVDPTGTWLVLWEGSSVLLWPVGAPDGTPPTEIGTHEANVIFATFHPDGERVASVDETGEVRLWSRLSRTGEPLLVRRGPRRPISARFDPGGERLAIPTRDGNAAMLDLSGPPDADPLLLRAGQNSTPATLYSSTFDPEGNWLVTGHGSLGVTFWPVARRYPYVLRGHLAPVNDLEFLPDGSALLSVSQDGTVREWPLTPDAGTAHRVVHRAPGLRRLAGGPTGRYFVVSILGHLVDRRTGALRRIAPDAQKQREYWEVAFGGPGGGRVALAPIHPTEGKMHVPVIDVESGETVHFLEAPGDDQSSSTRGIQFLPDGRLLATTVEGLRLWDVEQETYELLTDRQLDFSMSVSADGRYVLAVADEGPYFLDLETREERILASHGPVSRVALDPTGTIAVSRSDNDAVQAGPVTGEEPFRLVGPPEGGSGLAVSPDGRWIASSHDDVIVLWPMPEGEPLYGLPREELVARLQSLTNLRIVEDPESPEGFSEEFLPFPGWEMVPTW